MNVDDLVTNGPWNNGIVNSHPEWGGSDIGQWNNKLQMEPVGASLGQDQGDNAR